MESLARIGKIASFSKTLEGYNLEDVDIDGRAKLLWILKKQDVRTRKGLIRLMTGSRGGLLLTRQRTFKLSHKRLAG